MLRTDTSRISELLGCTAATNIATMVCKHRRCLLAGTLACVYICNACATMEPQHGSACASGPCRHLAQELAHDEHEDEMEHGEDLVAYLGDEPVEQYVMELHKDSNSDMGVMEWMLAAYRCASICVLAAPTPRLPQLAARPACSTGIIIRKGRCMRVTPSRV